MMFKKDSTLGKEKATHIPVSGLVGAEGFEPPTLCL
jgi:hypothetical protein